MRAFNSLVVAVALCAVAAPGRAADSNPPTSSAAQADQLFREARSLLDQGRYHEACRMFERSLELDPSPGTLLNLGNCYEQDGDWVRALSSFERALADSQLPKYETKRKAWIEAGSPRRDSLLARVPVINLSPSPTPGASVRLDGEALLQARAALRLNPGPHSFEVSAPGKRTLHTEVELRPAQRLDLELPALADVEVAPPVEGKPPAHEAAASSRSASAMPWILIGSGAALGVAGVVTAFMTKSKQDELEAGCGPGPVCNDPSLKSTQDSGENLEIATYLLWTAGGVGLAVGFTLLALDSGSKEAPTEVSLGCLGGSCGLHAMGSF